MSTFTDEVVRICNEEKEKFGNGAKKEWMDDVYKEVGKYWDQLATDPTYKDWAGYNGKKHIEFDSKGIPKKPKERYNKNQPWSAAFISWVAHEAGAKDAFSYAPSHSLYIVKALKEGKKVEAGKTSTAKFIARRHKKYTPKVGDLIACERVPKADPTFDDYPSYVAAGKYQSHCDFVVEVGASAVTTVGGNVSDSVKTKTWPLDSKGRIGNADPVEKSKKVICIIECLL